MPLAPRTARAIDLAAGGPCDGPIFVGTDGRRVDRHAAERIVRRIARCAGIRQARGTRHAPSRVHHRGAWCWRPPATCKRPPVTLTPEPPFPMTGPRSRSTGTPPTSSLCSSPAPAADLTYPLWPARSLQSGGITCRSQISRHRPDRRACRRRPAVTDRRFRQADHERLGAIPVPASLHPMVLLVPNSCPAGVVAPNSSTSRYRNRTPLWLFSTAPGTAVVER